MDNMSGVEQVIPSHINEEVDISQYLQPGDAPMDGFPADFPTEFLDFDLEFPGLPELVNEVTGGDVRNLDVFNDTVLGGTPECGVEVQNPVPLDEAILPPSNQSLDDNTVMKIDTQKDNTPVTQLTPVVVIMDGQYVLTNPMQFQMPQQSGVYGIAPQGLQLITLPVQNTITAVPSPPAAVNENAALDTATASSSTASSGSSKRKQMEESEAKTAAKKKKLYEAEKFSDPEMEKKRLNAINAKNHRVKTKLTIKDLEQKVVDISQDRDNLANQVEIIIKEREEERNGYIQEIQELRKQKEKLQKEHQKALQYLRFILQQKKCGIQEADIANLLH